MRVFSVLLSRSFQCLECRAIFRTMTMKQPNVHSLQCLQSLRPFSSDIVEKIFINNALENSLPQEEDVNSILEPCKRVDTSHVGRLLSPTFNLAAYVNKSVILQELVKLGVELHKFEHKKDVSEYLLQLDFENDMKPTIQFLVRQGVPPDELGRFFTKNPLIFKESLDDLQVRLNYLESKKFTSDNIASIITRNPRWLSLPVVKIDDRLGYFQEKFHLNGNEVRLLVNSCPRLITHSLAKVNLNFFVLKEECGFEERQIKSLILQKPELLVRGQKNLISVYEYAHRIMNIPPTLMLKQPEILLTRLFRVRERHMFLQSLGLAQYNPLQVGYVSLVDLVTGTDAEFAEHVAKSSVHSFNVFLKTL